MPPKRKKPIDSSEQPPAKRVVEEQPSSNSNVLLPIETIPTTTKPIIENLQRFKFSQRAVKAICGDDQNRFERGKEIYMCDSPYSVTCKVVLKENGTKEYKFQGKVPGTHKSFYRCNFCVKRLHIQRSDDISFWNCTCPDWGNPCKHLIAFCLYLSSVGKSVPILQPIEHLLQSKSREELIEMIEHLCNQNEVIERSVTSYLNDIVEEDESEEESDEDEEDQTYPSYMY